MSKKKALDETYMDQILSSFSVIMALILQHRCNRQPGLWDGAWSTAYLLKRKEEEEMAFVAHNLLPLKPAGGLIAFAMSKIEHPKANSFEVLLLISSQCSASWITLCGLRALARLGCWDELQWDNNTMWPLFFNGIKAMREKRCCNKQVYDPIVMIYCVMDMLFKAYDCEWSSY